MTLFSRFIRKCVLVFISAGAVFPRVIRSRNMKAERFFNANVVQLLNSIQENDLNNVQRLLAEGVELNAFGDKGITPLEWLIMQKDKKAAQLALDLGADPNVKDSDGYNAINFLAASTDPQWLRMLLAAGGDPNAIDKNGMPALFDAIGQQRWEDINTLLEYGANMNLKEANAEIVPVVTQAP